MTTARHAHTSPRSAFRVSEWVLGVVGVVGVFLGLFILFAGEDQYVGIGGDASWRVGDIAPGWAFGLLGVGLACVLAALALARWGGAGPTGAADGEQRARTDLVVHAVVFVLVNAFLWVQDLATGGGLDYAYWATIPWGIGLTVHAARVLTANRHQLAQH